MSRSPVRNTRRRLGRNRGFTLVEVLVVVVLAGLVSLFFLQMAGTCTSAWQEGEAGIMLAAELRDAERAIAEDLRRSSRVSPAGIIVGLEGRSITFQLPAGQVGGVMQWGDQVTYALGGESGTDLLRTNLDQNEVRVVARGIQDLRFDQRVEDPSRIGVALGAVSTGAVGRSHGLAVATEIGLRN